MSETVYKAPRTIQEITSEFQGFAMRAGNLSYQIECYQKDLELVLSTMRDLSFEAAAAQKQLADLKAKEEADKAATAKAEAEAKAKVTQLEVVKPQQEESEKSNES